MSRLFEKCNSYGELNTSKLGFIMKFIHKHNLKLYAFIPSLQIAERYKYISEYYLTKYGDFSIELYSRCDELYINIICGSNWYGLLKWHMSKDDLNYIIIEYIINEQKVGESALKVFMPFLVDKNLYICDKYKLK